jgi:hypothetical protein
MPEEDFWIYYFTSSLNIKKLIKEYGKDSFDILILTTSADYLECFWAEQELIKIHFSDPLCLNKHYINSLTGANRFTFRGKKHTDETKQKMKDNCKGMTGKHHSAESKEKIRKANLGPTGKTHSSETIKKMSDIKLGNTYGKGNKGRTGKIQSAESNNARSLKLKGKSFTQEHLNNLAKWRQKKIMCEHCRRELDSANYAKTTATNAN